MFLIAWLLGETESKFSKFSRTITVFCFISYYLSIDFPEINLKLVLIVLNLYKKPHKHPSFTIAEIILFFKCLGWLLCIVE